MKKEKEHLILMVKSVMEAIKYVYLDLTITLESGWQKLVVTLLFLLIVKLKKGCYGDDYEVNTCVTYNRCVLTAKPSSRNLKV